jgi:hypothetical protein
MYIMLHRTEAVNPQWTHRCQNVGALKAMASFPGQIAFRQSEPVTFLGRLLPYRQLAPVHDRIARRTP